MRKALVLLLALLVLGSAGTAYAVRSVAAAETALAYSMREERGNVSAAEGIGLTLRSGLSNRLLWESRVDFTESGMTAQTESRFLPETLREVYEGNENGVMLLDGWYYVVDGWNAAEDDNTFISAGLRARIKAAEAAMEPGSTVHLSIPLAEYFDDYPLDVQIELGGRIYTWHPDMGYGEAWEETDERNQEARAVLRLRDFFKIPVAEDDVLGLDLIKNYDGTVYLDAYGRSETEDGDSFSFMTECAISEKACYFWFDDHTVNGRIVDTSRIPGGYGIYMLPYGETEHGCDVFEDELTNFYPLAPETEILYLELGVGEQELLLHTVENGRYIITVIDADSAETIQRIDLTAYDREECWAIRRAGDIFRMVTMRRERSEEGADGWVTEILGGGMYLLTRQPDGSYQTYLSLELRGDELDPEFALWENWRNVDFRFDGERLVIAGSNMLRLEAETAEWTEHGWYTMRDTGCGFYLCVYTPEGLQYYGVYDCSLNGANLYDGNYYGTNPRPVNESAERPALEIRLDA